MTLDIAATGAKEQEAAAGGTGREGWQETANGRGRRRAPSSRHTRLWRPHLQLHPSPATSTSSIPPRRIPLSFFPGGQFSWMYWTCKWPQTLVAVLAITLEANNWGLSRTPAVVAAKWDAQRKLHVRYAMSSSPGACLPMWLSQRQSARLLVSRVYQLHEIWQVLCRISFQLATERNERSVSSG